MPRNSRRRLRTAVRGRRPTRARVPVGRAPQQSASTSGRVMSARKRPAYCACRASRRWGPSRRLPQRGARTRPRTGVRTVRHAPTGREVAEPGDRQAEGEQLWPCDVDRVHIRLARVHASSPAVQRDGTRGLNLPSIRTATPRRTESDEVTARWRSRADHVGGRGRWSIPTTARDETGGLEQRPVILFGIAGAHVAPVSQRRVLRPDVADGRDTDSRRATCRGPQDAIELTHDIIVPA